MAEDRNVCQLPIPDLRLAALYVACDEAFKDILKFSYRANLNWKQKETNLLLIFKQMSQRILQ